MRLDKYVATVTDYSRTDVKKLIKHGEVTINQSYVTNPAQHINPESDHIALSGQQLSNISSRYYMLYKPEGVVCANNDADNPTVIDFIDEPQVHKLQIAGRLDKDTTGLVLLTDDGQWNHCVTSPRKNCFKTYIVTLATPITQQALEQLTEGVMLNGEQKPTRPAQASLIDSHRIKLAIQEGKYHQVKRMMGAVGNRVTGLFRHSIGPILLDPLLKPGEYRPLNVEEINYFDTKK